MTYVWTDLAVSMDTHFKNTSNVCWLDDHSGSQHTYNNYGERECYGESNVLCIK